DVLNVDSNVVSQKLNRANYESVVFKDKMVFDAKYNKIDLSSKGIKAEDILWNQITLIVKTSNLKGIKNEMSIDVNNLAYGMEADYNSKDNNFYALESQPLKAYNKENSELNIKFDIEFTGSNKVQLIPLGKVTSLKMKSNWKDPSFIGNYLPSTDVKEVSDTGFNVNWKILAVNRPFSQIHKTIPNLSDYLFGTKFVVVADEYQQTERTAKYGILVISLTFLVFFLIQTLSKVNIHPFQYLMIGFALVLFYTLLISISEHSNFMTSYYISGGAVIILITIYAKTILDSIKFSSFIFMSLLSIYSFILVITQLENYSLLVGSVGLFIILAIVMFTSRNIDFYEKIEEMNVVNTWKEDE
ncbi:cell envelope integrity protein CreD, partial [Flavobacteriaceae bacterium]|nr:cell envelope integrity protein CreD [Flavobacteriaceae bacterium]